MMTSPALPAYALKLGLTNVHKLRRMTKPLARAWLKSMFDLTEEELSDALQLAKTPDDVVPHSVSADLERLGLAAVWLCGASARQLARFHGVAPQSLAQRLGRVFKHPLHDVAKITDQPMPDWRLELMIEHWNAMANDNLLSQSTYEVAKMLDVVVPTTNPEEESSEQAGTEGSPGLPG